MQTEARTINGTAPETELLGIKAHSPEVETIKVLLIEDNLGDARLIQLMLADAAGTLFETETVERLSAGLERLAADRIGIVLLDLSLPDSHGLDTFLHLHARAPRIPIIVLSGLNDTTV